MKDSDQWDRMLSQALASEEGPDERLNQNLIRRIEERKTMKPTYKKRFSVGLIVAICTLVLSVSAYAATQLFSSKEVAEHLGEGTLAKAFASSDAIEINQTEVSGDYKITLHGIVSGSGLRELENPSSEISPEKTYAVVSIANADGTPMPKTSDPEYGEVPFVVSPLIKGQLPWQVNIATMSGGYSETVLDGVMYRMIECDGVEMFADRGVYLAVIGGAGFISSEVIAYDDKTGEVSAKADYPGAAIVFDLPLNRSKADPAKAEAYLQELLKPHSSDKNAEPAETVAADSDPEAEMARQLEEWKKKVPEGTTIPESVKKVTYDDQGRLIYEHDGWNVKLTPDQLFEEGQTGDSAAVQFSASDDQVLALVFTKESNGDITGKVVELK